MSTYEDYAVASRSYDLSRTPVGIEITLGCLAAGATPLDRQRVLDAGCGTGNYAAPLADRVARVDGVDASEAMLGRAREKLADALDHGRASLVRASLYGLPFADASFDGVMVNQVLHHLGDGADDGWSRHRRVVAELARVLRPGGSLCVNTCSARQVREGDWYFRLIPDAAERLAARYLPAEALEELLGEVGISVRGRHVPVRGALQGEALLDGTGPLRQEWRDADSTWALATDEELDRAIASVRRMADAGELEEFVAENDRPRRDLGQVTVVHGVVDG